MESLDGAVGAYLAHNHITKKELADKVGVSVITLNRKAGGESELTFSQARKLSRELGVSLDDLWELTSK